MSGLCPVRVWVRVWVSVRVRVWVRVRVRVQVRIWVRGRFLFSVWVVFGACLVSAWVRVGFISVRI